MRQAGLNLLACRMPENVLLLSGYWPLTGVSILLFPIDADPICILPSTEEQEAAFSLGGMRYITYPDGTLAAGNPEAAITKILTEQAVRLRPLRVGMEGSFATMAPPVNAAEPAFPTKAGEAQLRKAFAASQLEDATGMLYDLRARKTEEEVARIRIANEIASFGLAAFASRVLPGVRGVDLLAEVEHEVTVRGTGYHGTRHVRAFAQVATGPVETAAGYRPCEISTTRRLEAGDIALLELAVTADGYWSDRTRPCVAGEPSTEMIRLLNVVVRAQEAAIHAIRPGIRAGQVDQAARAIIEDAGLGNEFLHVTGHGIGFRYHEPIPIIAPHGEAVLDVGMVFSVEPGVYSNRFGGIRIEDDLLVMPGGAEVLGPTETGLSR